MSGRFRSAGDFNALAAMVKGVIEHYRPDEEPEEEDYDDTEGAYNNGFDVAAWEICQDLKKHLDALGVD